MLEGYIAVYVHACMHTRVTEQRACMHVQVRQCSVHACMHEGVSAVCVDEGAREPGSPRMPPHASDCPLPSRTIHLPPCILPVLIRGPCLLEDGACSTGRRGGGQGGAYRWVVVAVWLVG